MQRLSPHQTSGSCCLQTFYAAPYKTVPLPNVSAIVQLLQCICLLLVLLTPLLPTATDGAVILKTLSERVMTTRYGKVRGVLVEFPNQHLKPVEAYFGLRYADLDEGAMRFMPPKNPKEQWNKIRVAFKHQPVCPQPTRHEREYSQNVPEGRATHLRNITPFLTEMREDCLTLNLYVPITGEYDVTLSNKISIKQ
ncbi:hypothetical protein PoB_000052500 [Plakobranchus ocellatus]|uniref:Carboxylesterase type B domain-containing protein n=1 Tax=Plakobranchus ocellatus TaxID=259542 RepID=A0AAV3XUF9_9GAST|nr:hypothetical protein PoB_000052500 [Plakobranchus ocellatus]